MGSFRQGMGISLPNQLPLCLRQATTNQYEKVLINYEFKNYFLPSVIFLFFFGLPPPKRWGSPFGLKTVRWGVGNMFCTLFYFMVCWYCVFVAGLCDLPSNIPQPACRFSFIKMRNILLSTRCDLWSWLVSCALASTWRGIGIINKR